MKYFKDGFSLKNGIIALSVAIGIFVSLPIVMESLTENEKIYLKINDPVVSIMKDLISTQDIVFAATQCHYDNWDTYHEYPWPAGCGEPMALDLNKDGIIEISSPKDGIYFDYNDNGIAVKTAWVSVGDGVLAVDFNKNGKIEGEKELVNAFNIKGLDTNKDGVVNHFDSSFKMLKIIESDGKIVPLNKYGIKSINVKIAKEDYTDKNGNYKFGSGTFERQAGQIYNFDEYLFKTDELDTIETDKWKETTPVSKLPDIKSRRQLHSLHQAMLRDAKLQALVEEFVKEQNEPKREQILTNIIYKWANVETINPKTDTMINAQHLAVVDAFMGTAVLSSTQSNKPFKADKYTESVLESAYQKLLNYVYAELMSQSHLSDLSKLMVYKDGKYDLTPVVKQLDKEISFNPKAGKERVYEFAKVIKGLDIDKNSNFLDAKDDDCYYLKFINNDRDFKWKIDTIATIPYKGVYAEGEYKGTAGNDAYREKKDKSIVIAVHSQMGNDVLYGDSKIDTLIGCAGEDILDGHGDDDILIGNQDNDIIFGGDGNDLIYGGEDDDIIFGGNGNDYIYPDHIDQLISSYNSKGGNDTIRGGKGNDVIYSMVGDDLYIFNLGDNQDTIYEYQGKDTLWFGKNIKWTDLIFTKSGNDMIVKIKNTKDRITIKDWFNKNQTSVNTHIEIFAFADGTVHTESEIVVQ